MASVVQSLQELSALGDALGPQGVEVLRRVVGSVYEELNDQVRRGDFDRLSDAVRELAEAQRRTEVIVQGLAEAQKQLTKSMNLLMRRMRHMEEEVGGLSRNAGLVLEDRAYPVLPLILRERLGLEVEGTLGRTFVEVEGYECEVNIWGLARKDGRPVRVVGESKVELSRRHINSWERRLEELRPAIAEPETCVVLLTSVARPDVVESARLRGWHVVFSYELEEARDRGMVLRLKGLLTA